LNLQCLDPLLNGCGGPTGVGRDGRHGAITSPMHPWEGGSDGEIDRGVWLAPPDSGMEFGSGAMHAKHKPYIMLLQWTLSSCLPKGPSNCRAGPERYPHWDHLIRHQLLHCGLDVEGAFGTHTEINQIHGNLCCFFYGYEI
jgi:hypothetical protein